MNVKEIVRAWFSSFTGSEKEKEIAHNLFITILITFIWIYEPLANTLRRQRDLFFKTFLYMVTCSVFV